EKWFEITRFDLDDALYLQRLENPTLALEPLSGLIIIDEIQKRPDLFPSLRVLIDKHKKPAAIFNFRQCF
ncbi:MAG: hypothetical protein K2Q33_04260, partial [Gammaproteobacteria bacterium]|nr:hypothetical protein [Gammaproteobacteria bacterium]